MRDEAVDLQRLSQAHSTASVPDDAEIWDLTSEEAGNAIETLAAETARKILACLYEEPRTASELAEATDNSVQNVTYHVSNLREAGLIEVAETRYSAKGTEMKVYTPTTNAVLLLSQETTAMRIKRLLSRLVAGVGALAIGAIIFRYVLVERLLALGRGGDDASAAGGTDDMDSFVDSTESEVTGRPVELVEPLQELPFLLDPGVVFFLGGVFVLVVLVSVRAIRAA